MIDRKIAEVIEARRKRVHAIIFDDTLHALNIGAPGLGESVRQAIATSIAVRASHHIANEGAEMQI